MFVEAFNYLLGSLSTVTLIYILAFIFRGSIFRFFSKHMDSVFDEKIEIIKSNLRIAEQKISDLSAARNKELDTIRESLLVLQNDKLNLTHKKRVEAAEKIFILSDKLSQLKLGIEMLKSINLDKLTKDNNKQDAKKFFEILSSTSNLDKALQDMKDYPIDAARLFLSNTAWAYFTVYRSILTYGAIKIKFYETGLNDESLFKEGHLSSSIIELVPNSKEGFDKYGEEYAFYWLDYVHDNLILQLQKIVNGEEDEQLDAEKAAKIAKAAKAALTTNELEIPDTIKK